MTDGERPGAGEDASAELPVLPGAVRSRLVAAASDALGRLPADALPGPLRRVAGFAPSRRARLAGTEIAAVLAADPGFRGRVADLVREEHPELARALEEGTLPAAADPVEVAALAYLLRPQGWEELLARAVAATESERADLDARKGLDRVGQLERRLESVTEQARQARQQQRDEVARHKEENADLRRRLGDARALLRAAEQAAREAEARVAEAERERQAALAAAEAELRRSRARVEELEVELAAFRRSERVERDAGSLRARLLLDTLLDTAQGLRRELALPPVEGAPADLVEAHVAEEGTRPSSGQGSLGRDDPSTLEALLALPRVHLVVDGYNVTKQTWPELTLERQRDQLLSRIAPLAARSGAETTVVFDAAETRERPLVARPRGVRVLFSRYGVIADDVIRDLVAAEPQGRPVVVVTDDRAVATDVAAGGARCVGSAALLGLLGR